MRKVITKGSWVIAAAVAAHFSAAALGHPAGTAQLAEDNGMKRPPMQLAEDNGMKRPPMQLAEDNGMKRPPMQLAEDNGMKRPPVGLDSALA